MADEERRISALETKLDSIDQHGTRGMEAVRSEIGVMQRDMGKLESTVGRMEANIQTMQLSLAALKPRSPWPALVAYTGIIVPMYALVIDLIVQRLH